MTILYYDCFSGISGDMHLGALIDLGVDPERMRAGLAGLGLPGWELRVARVSRGGIEATRAEVCLGPARQPARHLAEVSEIIQRAGLSARAQGLALAAFQRLAEAEGRVHGCPPEALHFHEVGAVDALVDVVGAALGLEQLGWPRVVAGPIELGSGYAECAHGRLPVPAPATLELLRAVPTRLGGQPFEATTPTGAAILTAAAERFGEPAGLAVQRIGYGAGARDGGALPNLLRLLLAQEWPSQQADLVELECNLDDLSPELHPFVIERLLAAGALDAYLVPVVMKKGRAGILLRALCEPHQVTTLTNLLFAETTTLGVRRRSLWRTALPRSIAELPTRFGPVPVKVARLPDGRRRVKPEYEACRALALAQGLPLVEVYREVERRLEEWDGE